MNDACLIDMTLPQCWGGAIGETVAGGAVASLADAMSEGLSQAIASIATLWVDFPTPAIIQGSEVPQAVSPPDTAGVTTVMQYALWVCLALAVISLMGLGALIATRRRSGEGIAAVGRLGFIIGGVLVISAAGAVVAAMLPSGPTEFGAASYLQSRLWWFMGAAAVVGVAIGGARMAWEQRGEPGRDTLKAMLTLLVVAGSSTVIISMLTVAADNFSSWLIADSLDCSIDDTACFSDGIEVVFGLGNLVMSAGGAAGATLSAIVVIVFGLGALLASGIQIMLMIARSAMLVILTGILPLSASATNTEMGKTWFKRSVGWAAAFILYKPAAAIVYATGFQLIGEGGVVSTDSLVESLAGIMLLAMAIVALPALLRFTVPMVGAMAGGAAGGGAVAAGMAALPTGAMAISGGGGSKNGAAGATGDSGPSGSDGTAGKGTQGSSGPTGGQSIASGGGAASAGGAAAAGGASGGAAVSGGAAGGATAAGSAAGPVGAAAGMAADGAAKAGKAMKSGAESAAGEGDGPSGSNG